MRYEAADRTCREKVFNLADNSHALPGLVVINPGGAIDTIATLDVRDGRVVAIYAMRNPSQIGSFVPP